MVLLLKYFPDTSFSMRIKENVAITGMMIQVLSSSDPPLLLLASPAWQFHASVHEDIKLEFSKRSAFMKVQFGYGTHMLFCLWPLRECSQWWLLKRFYIHKCTLWVSFIITSSSSPTSSFGVFLFTFLFFSSPTSDFILSYFPDILTV